MLLFCEYTLTASGSDAFREWAGQRPSLWNGVRMLESIDQPGVMLEIWPAADEQDARRIEKERLGGRSEWTEMDEWVKGGRSGIRVWTFRPYFSA